MHISNNAWPTSFFFCRSLLCWLYPCALPGHDCHPPPPLHCVPVRPILQCARDIRGELTASTCRARIVRDVRMEEGLVFLPNLLRYFYPLGILASVSCYKGDFSKLSTCRKVAQISSKTLRMRPNINLALRTELFFHCPEVASLRHAWLWEWESERNFTLNRLSSLWRDGDG